MGRGHGHGHGHITGRWARLRHWVVPHSHDTADVVDDELEASRQGMRALWISFCALTLTAVGQAVLVAFTGSVALLGDTAHNFADALTAVPLAIAFLLGRRAASRRFTYGLGRAEDVAGLVIVLLIAVSAGLATWQVVERLLEPRPLTHVWWLAGAGALGFLGNELVARYRISVGRRIGSAALVADGLHARTDGCTSLAVVLSAGGSALGWHWADPVIGLLITALILSVLWSAAREVCARLLDAVDPRLVDSAERALLDNPDVQGVDRLRLRWVGHHLTAEADLRVGHTLSLLEAHRIAHEAEHRLLHELPRLETATIHPHPGAAHSGPQHEVVAHHRRAA